MPKEEPIMSYDKMVGYADTQIAKDFTNPLFLFVFCSLVILFIIAFLCRKNFPYIYLSALAGFNAFVIAYCARIGMIFVPAVFVFFLTFERFRNMNV